MKRGFHEKAGLRNRRYVFKDRFDAGAVLAQMLQPGYRDRDEAIVLAIPAGGAPTGLEIGRRLEIDFDLIIVRKLQIPSNPEAGFGAMSMDGSLFLNRDLLRRLDLSREQIQRETDRVRAELEKRNRLFREGRPFPDLSGRTVLLVDDGLASGYTMMAAIDTARQRQAEKVVIAVPTAPIWTIEKIRPLSDEIYCANVREAGSFAVAEAYENWYDLSEEETLALLRGNMQKGGNPSE